MRTLFFVFMILITNKALFANDAHESSEEQVLDQKKNDLDEILKNSRAVPYMKDGKVEGYIMQGKDGQNQNMSDLRLKQGDVITAPNTDENTEK